MTTESGYIKLPVTVINSVTEEEAETFEFFHIQNLLEDLQSFRQSYDKPEKTVITLRNGEFLLINLPIEEMEPTLFKLIKQQNEIILKAGGN